MFSVSLQIHRGVQVSVVLLTVIGFIIALVFVEENNDAHFHNGHQVMGLFVAILALLQPLNAVFRAHPPEDGGWKDGKPKERVIWEYLVCTYSYSMRYHGQNILTSSVSLI